MHFPPLCKWMQRGFAGFTYTLTVAGERIPEAMEVTDEGADKYKVTIPRACIGRDEENGSVVWFQVDTVCTAGDGTQRQTSVHRRFRDFGELSDDLRSSFKGNHLLGNVPDLPRKELKIIANHMDPVFIEERRVRLELFMARIVQVGRFCTAPCLLSFVGMSEQVG